MKQMKEEAHMDILCIGQINAGKSFFLKQYTQDPSKQKLSGEYDIYAKKIDNKIVYFHELSEEEGLYLHRFYDGLLFFVDFVDTWYAVQNILKWMELYSKFTGTNIFKIPIRVIITKAGSSNDFHKERKSLQKELSSVVNASQIIYFQDVAKVQAEMEQYLREIEQETAQGIKCTNKNHIRLYGVRQIFKFLAINTRLTFFRCAQVFDTHIKSRFTVLLNLK